MNITTYIRKEDEHLWNLIENKAQWIHEQLNQLAPTPTIPRPKKVPAEPVYEVVPDKIAPTVEPPKLKVLTNSDLQTLLGGKAAPIKDEPRHICKDNCKHWIWDANSGKYNNSLTGEVRDAPEF